MLPRGDGAAVRGGAVARAIRHTHVPMVSTSRGAGRGVCETLDARSRGEARVSLAGSHRYDLLTFLNRGRFRRTSILLMHRVAGPLDCYRPAPLNLDGSPDDMDPDTTSIH